MDFVLDKSVTPFNLDHTLNCGQAFRWKKLGDWWYGLVGENVAKLKQADGKLVFYTYPEQKNVDFIEDYFRLDDDLRHILSRINRDAEVNKAIEKFYGLRIIRQDPWECLISYICATNANIPGIKNVVSSMARNFGKKVIFESQEFHAFPKPDALARASLAELGTCGLGYRARYVLGTSRLISSGAVQFESLKGLDYEDARAKLLALPGVGQKVADCVLLFSLDKLEAFPVDIWVKRIVLERYPEHFDSFGLSDKGAVASREYHAISAFGRGHFGKYAGYAQEYLFYYRRSRS